MVKKAINILFDTDLKDIMTGYRVFNKRFVKNMPVLSPKFEIETEMSLYALDKKYIIKEDIFFEFVIVCDRIILL